MIKSALLLNRVVSQDREGVPMPLQGEAKKRYHREYMQRRRAGLPTQAPPKPKGKCCSVCARPPSQERIVIVSGNGVRICETCNAEITALIAEQRATQ